MARSKTKNAGKQKKQPPKAARKTRALPAVDPVVVRRVAPPLGVGLAVLLACAGAVYAVAALETRLADRLGTAPEVIFQWPALASPEPDSPSTWLPEEFQRELLERAQIAMGENPDQFSAEPLDRVSTALAATGWFVDAPVVRRINGNRIEIDAAWRDWVAVVRVNERDFLISRDGRPMPPAEGYGLGAVQGLIAITGASMRPQGFATGATDFSSPWPGDDVAAALRLVQVLRSEGFADQIVAVDLSDYARTDSLTLVTTPDPSTGLDARIDFGAPPGPDGRSTYTPGERSLQSKLEQLREFDRVDGHIAAGTAGYDLRPEALVYERVMPRRGRR